MKEVVRKEILKLLEAGIIYPVAHSQWVSPVHCVPKKGGITVVPNDKNELIPQRILTGYRMVIDLRELNKELEKIITLFLLLIKCLKDYLSTHTFASLMDILAFHKYLFLNLIKKRPLLLVLLEPMLTDV